LDGGLSDSIPVKYFQSISYDKNVVVLTQPEGYVKEINKQLKYIKKVYRKYPKFIDTIANRHNVYNETLEYIRKQEAELREAGVYVCRTNYRGALLASEIIRLRKEIA
jgi:predicted patatin/cPLA2 family phospholipase